MGGIGDVGEHIKWVKYYISRDSVSCMTLTSHSLIMLTRLPSFTVNHILGESEESVMDFSILYHGHQVADLPVGKLAFILSITPSSTFAILISL